MVNIFYNANQKIRSRRPIFSKNVHCEFFEENDLLEIAVPAHRCIHDMSGGCIMCNFGVNNYEFSNKEILDDVEFFLNSTNKNYRTIILCTNGSFFDDNDVSFELQNELFKKVNETNVNTIIIETHIDTLSKKRLIEIRKELYNKNIIIEVGLESVNPFIQENCYLKRVSTSKLVQMIDYANCLNIKFQLNIILGAPFLSNYDRLIDTKNSIQWALDNNALVTLFPMNIKPYTLLYYAYKNCLYKPISHWDLILLLNNYEAKELEKIDLAWYGNRKIDYMTTDKTIFPTDCELCHNDLQSFYSNYCAINNGSKRKELVNFIINKGQNMCKCLNNAKFDLIRTDYSIENQVQYFHNKMINALSVNNL